MSEAAGHHTQTLGACLSSLASGDPCPCCGGRLERAATGSPRRDKVLSGRQSAPAAAAVRPPDAGRGDSGALHCIACGCEIDGAEEPFQTTAELAFSVAA